MSDVTDKENNVSEGKDNENFSPMIKQYLDIKKDYEDYVLLYRLGDFYEMFFKDALEISKELELTLTSRAGNPMCGVPHHSSEIYIKKLVDNGHKVAICEQIGDPSLKGLVERAVVRIVTAGTLIEDSMLDETKNNFIASFFAKGDSCGFIFADLSTGELNAFEKQGKNLESEIISEISRFVPVELLFNSDFMNLKNTGNFIRNKLERCTGELLDNDFFDISDLNPINEQFGTVSLQDLGMETLPLATCALNALFRYFYKTGKKSISRFTGITIQTDNEFMELGLTTRRNLELTETIRNKERRGSLMWVLDKTCTSMGKRKLRQFIERPLTGHSEILKRLDAVDELVHNIVSLGDICSLLSGIYDLERLMTRIVYKTAGPHDVFSLGKTSLRIPELKLCLDNMNSPLLKQLNNMMNSLEDITALVENAIMPEPPALTKDGNYINNGFNEELDRLRNIKNNNNNILTEIENREKEATGIRTLRVGYNRVFGYYIEVSKGSVSAVPGHYIRKQTLTNGERYITDELKKIENEILGANDKILALEAEIFAEVRDFITSKLEAVQLTAEAVSVLDVLCSYANAAIENNYCRPSVTFENVIDLKDARHPVVEKILHDRVFTPNDTYLDLNENRLIIITGPNMAGKSTYMRQVALISLMTQIGCFVPAKTARIGVVDKIFTRIGASDDLTAGQSTFMVEMNEVAEILNNATSKSLVILDEIGRGTSTFDGISIAKAVAEYINSKAIGCKTLFATHYHELIALEKKNQGIRNFSVKISKKGDEIHFLHKIIEGGVSDSYGIEVAKLAGLPQKVINNAKLALKQMELGAKTELETELRKTEEEPQIDFYSIAKENVIKTLKAIDINSITPIEALQELSELKKGLE